MGKEKMYFVDDNAGRMLIWTDGTNAAVFNDNNTENLWKIETVEAESYLKNVAAEADTLHEPWEKIEVADFEEILNSSKVLAIVEF